MSKRFCTKQEITDIVYGKSGVYREDIYDHDKFFVRYIGKIDDKFYEYIRKEETDIKPVEEIVDQELFEVYQTAKPINVWERVKI